MHCWSVADIGHTAEAQGHTNMLPHLWQQRNVPFRVMATRPDLQFFLQVRWEGPVLCLGIPLPATPMEVLSEVIADVLVVVEADGNLLRVQPEKLQQRPAAIAAALQPRRRCISMWSSQLWLQRLALTQPNLATHQLLPQGRRYCAQISRAQESVDDPVAPHPAEIGGAYVFCDAAQRSSAEEAGSISNRWYLRRRWRAGSTPTPASGARRGAQAGGGLAGALRASCA